MKGSMRTEAKEIQLQTLALDHPHVGYVLYIYSRKVRLPCDRTQRGKLRTLKAYSIVSILMLVFKCLQDLRSIVICVYSLLIAEERKALNVSLTRGILSMR